MEERTVADRVMSLIKSEGISASSFADKIGVQRSAISHISKGRNEPSVQLIKKIALAYPNVNVEWLFLGFGNMYKDGTSGNTAVEYNTQASPKPETNDVDNDSIVKETASEIKSGKTPHHEPAAAKASKPERRTAAEEPAKVVTTSSDQTANVNTISISQLSNNCPDQLIVFDPRDKTFTIYKQAQ